MSAKKIQRYIFFSKRQKYVTFASVKIGDIDFGSRPLFLAPMEDVTDASFRYICKKFGADMVYTEFVSSDALVRDVPKSLAKFTIYDYERPIGIQIYGHIPDAMADSAVKVAASTSTSAAP